MSKTILPNDFRDFLSIISIIGFIGIFMKFVLDNVLISESMDALFLIIGGAGLMVAGKVFTVREWLRDGIQTNEITKLLSIIFGITSMFIGLLLIIGTTIPLKFTGLVGVLALFPAVFILLDYIAKNTRRF